MKNTLRNTNSSLPVSTKYYSRLQLRIRSIIDALSLTDANSVEAAVMDHIHHYFHNASCHPQQLNTSDICCSNSSDSHSYNTSGNSSDDFAANLPYVIFLTLRAEIDTAITRSRRARESASRRRSLRQSIPAIATTSEDSTPGSTIPEATSPEATPQPTKTTPAPHPIPSTAFTQSDRSAPSEKSEKPENPAPRSARRFRCGLKATPARSLRSNRKFRR